ncbi:DUF2442 domain-containing protein [Candidatus Chloroploca sp. M-50]|uniref:DUF2442 domain-containing protein n=1 Tax=Candidatus Chloroploca mongolica TaxID=2528176 RepID=A0ABS4DFV7_9CHLR|nr:DUF2442 domain-containing protein [Candidatus Chloroploca mongolica]MBP1468317.1 DUF2442 domain-containing protein [Candidatus Chloroploca mongolica]NCC34451.1 DUF2442 domain-containing protein [Chloroflexia bacterium]
MVNVHAVESISSDSTYLYLTVDGQSYRIRWEHCSPRLRQATVAQRKHLEVSPSGYGIHWPEVDEDLALTPLLQDAERMIAEPVNEEG